MESETENPEKMQAVLQIPFWTFLISFTGGTVLFLLQLVNINNDGIVFIGFYYVLAAFAINVVVLIAMLICAIQYKQYSNLILRHTSLILLNIPIAVLYIFLLFISLK